MSSSSNEQQKRLEILEIIEAIEKDSENKALEEVINSLTQRFDSDSFSVLIENCEVFWLQLKQIKKRIHQDKPINPTYLPELLDLLNDSVKVENSKLKILTFESPKAASDYFGKLSDICRNCLKDSAPVSDYVYFIPRHQEKNFETFGILFGPNKLKHNLFDNLIDVIPCYNPGKYVVKMFGLNICVEQGMCIEASPSLSSFHLVYSDNIRIPITLQKENIVEIFTIDDSLTIPVPNRAIADDEERILVVCKFIYPKGHPKGVEYCVSKLGHFIENFILNNAESVTSDGEEYDVNYK